MSRISFQLFAQYSLGPKSSLDLKLLLELKRKFPRSALWHARQPLDRAQPLHILDATNISHPLICSLVQKSLVDFCALPVWVSHSLMSQFPTFGSTFEEGAHTSWICIKLGTHLVLQFSFLYCTKIFILSHDNLTHILHLVPFFRIYRNSSHSCRTSNSTPRSARLSISRRLASRTLNFCNRYMPRQLRLLLNR